MFLFLFCLFHDLNLELSLQFFSFWFLKILDLIIFVPMKINLYLSYLHA
jgi:hypothetical protein